MATKRLSIARETGKTFYAVIRRMTDGYYLNDADGSFASDPADKYLSLAEDSVLKGLYEQTEARQTWNDGDYLIAVYDQAGGSPDLLNDLLVGTGLMNIEDDAEVDQVTILDEVNTIPTNPLLTDDARLANLDAAVSSRLADEDYTAPDNAGIAASETILEFVQKWILNRLVESPAGTYKLYDDNGTTVLKTWTVTASERTKAV